MVPIRWKVLPIGEAQPLLSRQIKTEEGLEVEVKVEEESEEAQAQAQAQEIEVKEEAETHQEIEANVKEEQAEVEAQVQAQAQEIEVKVEEARVKEEEDQEEVYRVRSIAPPRTKLTMGISSRANSSEGETDPPEGPPEEPSEGPSGYGTADKQQHAKRKPACTTAADCDAPVEQLQREMFADIMQQAKTTAETISDLSQPRTPHERIVYAYSALLREEMLQIPESQWHSYCLEGLVLARAHRHLLPSPMRPMSFMPHPQMGMMAPQHAPQVHCETFQ
ncbi:ensconsin-like isoform X3 [Amblyraja radiata]|uniref:ensconsin-like isoform X3 n=1 Tax=Amblyraja radiata TaxID=386614 RepID=UPI00140227B4|nr:ensconsin-like isoform X3 [Amblyraja radiata]